MIISDLKGKIIGAAVSGGLDSCTITRWMTDHGVHVVCFIVDLGQPDETDFSASKERLHNAGAKEVVIIDGKHRLAESGMKVVQAQAMYEGGYWNTTGIARYVITELVLAEMEKRGIKIFTHGATGRGNDQVRFQLAANMLNPDMEIYVPWRDSAFLQMFGGRKEMIDFCNAKGIPITATYEQPYSTDANFLGLTHEAGKLESLETPADFVSFQMGVSRKEAPDQKEMFTVSFEKGLPVKINGEKVTSLEAFFLANDIGGRNAIGIGEHVVENRFVGIKSRGVYEMPGIELLGQCYEFLLQVILDRRARRLFEVLSAHIGEQIYQGYWFDPSSRAAMIAIEYFSSFVTGQVTVGLYKGNILEEKIESVPYSLYSESASSMEKVGSFNHEDAEGFLNVLGVSAKALQVSKQLHG